MKKLIFILTLLVVVLTGCDNNKGPFETRKENGYRVLYSNGKLAKGEISNSIYLNDGTRVVVSEAYYEKGIPSGDFKLYDRDGDLIMDAKGKWKDEKFIGEIKYNGKRGFAKGKFSIHPNFVAAFDGQIRNLNFIYKWNLFILEKMIEGKGENSVFEFEKENGELTGTYKEYSPYSGKLLEERKYEKPGVLKSEDIYTPEGKLLKKLKYKNGKQILLEWYHENGNKSLIFQNDESGKQIYEVSYYENGNKKTEKKYDKEGREIYTEWYENGNKKREQKYDKEEGRVIYTEWYENGKRIR